jgi:excinuclease ABC subunit B
MGITPETIKSQIKDILGSIYEADYAVPLMAAEEIAEYDLLTEESIKKLESEMKEAARRLEFEKAADIRDRIKTLKDKVLQLGIKEKADEKKPDKKRATRKNRLR